MRLTQAEQACLLQGTEPTEAEVLEAITLPYPQPQSWEEIRENRRVAAENGGYQHVHFPNAMPSPQVFQNILDRLAALENQVSNLATCSCELCSSNG